MGMMAAFVYWELRFDPTGPVLPAPIALFLVLGVIAPAFGLLIERLLIRNLQGAALATTLVVTVGLFSGLIGLAQTLWPPRSRVVQGFFEGNDFEVFGVIVTWHRAATILIAIAVALGLRILLYRTRIGIAMRAVVDNRELAGLNGAPADRVSALSWALGASLAALAGILLAPVLSLEILALTLLVINAYAAAMVGRLRSLPMTLLGAVILGLLVQYLPTYLPRLYEDNAFPPELQGFNQSIPILMLFVVLLILPEAQLRGWTARTGRRIRVPGLRQSLIAGGALVTAAIVVQGLLADRDVRRVGEGLAFGLIVLSLVPLTGYAGQISLAQLTFAGVGAWVMSEVAAGGAPIGILAAMLLTGAVGALIALPALRLQGLYLALSTLSVAVLADNMFFPQQKVFFTGTTEIPRLDLGFMDFESNRSYFILLAVTFAIVGNVVVAMRRGPFGRRLVAMKDSPAACATLGLNLTRTKLAVFALSASLAGLGGVMYGGLRGGVQGSTFNMIAGLPILLLAVIGGIATVSGALFGGMFFALINIVSQEVESLDWLVLIAPGFIGITLGRNPDGAIPDITDRFRAMFHRRAPDAEPTADEEAAARRKTLERIGPALPLGAPLEVDQVRALDEVVGAEEVDCLAAARD